MHKKLPKICTVHRNKGGIKSLVRLVKKNGEVVDAELFGKFVCDENKNLVQFNGVMRDITERINPKKRLKNQRRI